MARRPRHPILGHAAQTTAYYPLKRGGAYPQFFGKAVFTLCGAIFLEIYLSFYYRQFPFREIFDHQKLNN